LPGFYKKHGLKPYCTMIHGSLKHFHPPRMLSLKTLYRRLTSNSLQTSHRAMDDVLHTLTCFLILYRQKKSKKSRRKKEKNNYIVKLNTSRKSRR
jgi:hypothetical protein